MKSSRFQLYCCAILLIVVTPLLCTAVNYISNKIFHKTIISEQDLHGVVNTPPDLFFSFDAVRSGQFQSDFEKKFAYNLVTRKTQARIYNQILYSLFHTTSNPTITIGKNNYLFETPYATAYFTELSTQHIDGLKENIAKLSKLYKLLKEKNVLLVVRMSPSKAEHYPEYLPSAYDRFLHMKRNGEYKANWYQVFREEITKTDISYYDRYELFNAMKDNGEIVFTKGGTHWSAAPMAEYINGLNSLIERNLGTKLGRMIIENYAVKTGEMGIPSDRDIWDLAWNAFYYPANYPSPHISFSGISGKAPLRVFTVGQSFTNVLLPILYSVKFPVWEETLFSWYNARVLKFPSDVPWGTQISAKTSDYEKYLGMDVILIDFLECGDGSCQFQFVDNMLNYLEKNPNAGKPL